MDPNQPVDNDEGLSICMSNHSRDFDTLRRYETTIERAWYRAIRELKAAQKERRENEAVQAQADYDEAYSPPPEDTIAKRHASSPMANEVTTPANRTNKANSQLSDIGIGCVSQSEPNR